MASASGKFNVSRYDHSDAIPLTCALALLSGRLPGAGIGSFPDGEEIA
jgi:hypothetical protein